MALPTAATAGYGYYYTLGPTPDVACDCLRQWLPMYKRVLRAKGLGEIAVWQCTGALDASGGVHSQGGAFDIGGISVARAMVAREMGAPATWVRNWSGNQHTHGVLAGCPHNGPAAYQIPAVYLRRDGLGYRGLAGPDPHPAPSAWRTWQQGMDWARRQLSITDSTDSEEWDVASSDYISAQIKAVSEQVAYVSAQCKALGNLIAGADEAVWTTEVHHSDGSVPIIQEIADIKTALNALNAKVGA